MSLLCSPVAFARGLGLFLLGGGLGFGTPSFGNDPGAGHPIEAVIDYFVDTTTSGERWQMARFHQGPNQKGILRSPKDQSVYWLQGEEEGKVMALEESLLAYSPWWRNYSRPMEDAVPLALWEVEEKTLRGRLAGKDTSWEMVRVLQQSAPREFRRAIPHPGREGLTAEWVTLVPEFTDSEGSPPPWIALWEEQLEVWLSARKTALSEDHRDWTGDHLSFEITVEPLLFEARPDSLAFLVFLKSYRTLGRTSVSLEGFFLEKSEGRWQKGIVPLPPQEALARRILPEGFEDLSPGLENPDLAPDLLLPGPVGVWRPGVQGYPAMGPVWAVWIEKEIESE